MTRIVSNLENDGSFSIKSIEIEFHSCFGDRDLLERSVRLVML